GVALGGRLAAVLFGTAAAPVPAPDPPAWTTVPALVLGTLTVGVLFRARPQDTWWIVPTGFLSYAGVRWGVIYLGPELGAFVGALLLGVASNAIAVRFDRPSVVTLIPGLMVLVPGSVGFRSLESLLARDVITGIGTAFSMV